jgi:hypothetical protein
MSAEPSLASLSVHAGEDARVDCYLYPREGPILTVQAGRTWLNLTIAGRSPIPASGVAFARALVREAQRFAAECERLHAAQQAQAPDAGQSEPGAA